MSGADLGAIANRLFEDFLAPLVLGGDVKPGRPIGARAALTLGRERVLTNIDLSAHVELARRRIARRLLPLDRLEGPTEAEWAMGAALHDLVQAAHPGFNAAFRRSAPIRLLQLCQATLERVPAPASVGEALTRHTWFARLFEMERVDTVVRWWVGSSSFLGEAPPARLTAWPELRRVHVEKSPRSIMDLPAAGAAVDRWQFSEALSAFLAKTPLTDLATCQRATPVFVWRSETLGLVATAPGRVLATRALATASKEAVDASLGRATRALVAGREWRAVGAALELLAERALFNAEVANGKPDSLPLSKDTTDDATYARCAGALAACEELRLRGAAFSPSDRNDLLTRLTLLANTPAAQSLRSDLAGDGT
jgi:hypothetical protein